MNPDVYVMNLAVVIVMSALIVAAYFVGKDAGIDHERRRNARRRSHQHNTRKEHN